MRVLGLTGSIGMGKSTTASMFRSYGIPVYDADLAVHRLYRGAAAAPIETAFPGTVRGGEVDRAALSARISGDPDALDRLEKIVHPFVRSAEEDFVAKARIAPRRLVVLDIPLLFEAGGADRVDTIIVVTAPAEVQRARVLARPDMSETKFEALLARQTADSEKRRRAHFIIDTSYGLLAARDRVGAVLRAMHYAV